MECSEYIKSKPSVLIYGLMLSSTTIFFGYGVGIFNVFFDIFIKAVYGIEDVHRQKEIKGNLNLLFLIGGTIASLVTGMLIDKLGRYRLLILLSVGELMTILLIMYKSLYVLYVCRLLWGCIGCALTFVCILMIKEIVPGRYSTQLNNGTYVFLTGGILISTLMSRDWMGKYWRLILAIPIFLELPKFLCYLFIYRIESPKTIASQGAYPREELIENYRKIYDEIGAKLKTEKVLKEIEDSRSLGKDPDILDLFRKRYRLAFMMGLLLNFLNQATGINFLILYSNDILVSMKIRNPEFFTLILSLLNIGGAIYITIFGKYHGRRGLLIFGLAMQAFGHLIFLLGIGIVNCTLVITGFFLFMFSFSISLGGSLFPYLADIIPAVGISFVAITQWLLACFIGKFAMSIMDVLGVFNTFFIFMIIASIGCFLFAGYSVTTEEKTESQIQTEFENKRFII